MTIDRSAGTAGSLAWTLSIDFGTSSTVVVASTHDGQVEVIEIDGERRVPSVLLLDDDNSSWAIGRRALDLAPSHPANVVRAPKRRLGDQTPLIVAGRAFRPVAIVAEVLRFAADAATRSMGSAPGAVRLTYPATWSRPMQARLAEAAALAGLAEPTFVTEPVAAAFSLPRHPSAGANVAVYDLGGGTFDTTIVRSTERGYEVIGRPTGDPAFGGELFDEIILNHVGEQLDERIWDNLQVSTELEWKRTRMRLLNACRGAKEALTTSNYADVTVGHPTGLIEQRVTRAELDALVTPYIDESIELVHRAIGLADLAPSDLEAIHLIGGASRMPIIRERVSNAFADVPIHQLGDPRTAVALGAAKAVVERAGPARGRTVQPDVTAAPPAAPTTPVQPARAKAPSPPAVAPQPAASPAPRPHQQPVASSAPAARQPAMPPPTHQQPAPASVSNDQSAGAVPQTASTPSDTTRIAVLAGAGIGAVLLLGILFFALRPEGDTAATDPTVSVSQTTLPTTAPTSAPSTASTTAPTTAPTTTVPPSSAPTPGETVALDGGPTALDVERTLIKLTDLPAEDGWTQVDSVEYIPFTLCDFEAPTPPVYIDGVAFDKGEGNNSDRIVSRNYVFATEEDAIAFMERERQMLATCPGGEWEIGGETFGARFITPDGPPVEGLGDETIISGVVFSIIGGEEVSFTLGTRIRHGRTVSEASYSAPEPVDETDNDLLLEVSVGQFLSVIGLER